MRYLHSVLRPDETVLHDATISWTTYVPGLAVLALAIIVFGLLKLETPAPAWFTDGLGFILLGLSLILLFLEWFERWTTEIVITNHRIILKRGFIRRSTVEMHMDKVESVDVEQSVLGRLFNFGDVTVRGTGAGMETLRQVDDPVGFRNHVKTHEDVAASSPH